MRLFWITGLILLAWLLVAGCGGGDHSGKVEKSGAAGPQDSALGDAPPTSEGPAAVEVRYTEQTDGVISRDIVLKADSTFTITLHGYAEKNAREKSTRRWDTKLKDVQTGAIMEGCSYEIMTALKDAMPTPTPDGGIVTIAVRFANGEEISVQASNRTPPPNDFRAIAHALVELAKEKVMDTRIKPVEIQP
jgi:hypothetical protein